MGVMGSSLAYMVYAPATSVISSQPLPATTDLSDSDKLLSEAIFRAQARGDYPWADTLIGQLDNTVLVGTMQAQRYLSDDYSASKEELSAWLASYGDQPQAPRIRALAQRKGAPRDRLAEMASINPLRGNGYIDHLGRRSMPDSFYRGLAQWINNNPSSALRAFTAAASENGLSPWHQASAHYWAYRAALKMGDTHQATAQLKEAGKFATTFYGQLANQQLGNRGAIMAAMPTVPSSLRDLPAVLRAKALASVNERELAENELRALITTMDTDARPAILSLASEMGLANLQVRLASLKSLSPEEKLFAQYPMPSWLVSAQTIIDPSLMLSMARQESSFRDEVTSHMGAVGMMQMLPSTARHVEGTLSAETIALASNDGAVPLSKQLDDPAVNVRLGAEYVSLLARQPMVKNSLIPLIAAYNAGPGTVQNWQKLARNINDPLLYIESIPYPETRNYVMQVMAHQWVYQTLMGQPTLSREALARGEWAVMGAPLT